MKMRNFQILIEEFIHQKMREVYNAEVDFEIVMHNNQIYIERNDKRYSAEIMTIVDMLNDACEDSRDSLFVARRT